MKQGNDEYPIYRNVALNRAVYHSTCANYNQTGHLITNGIILSKEETFSNEQKASYSVWTSSKAGEQWVTIDLGTLSTIDKVVIYWANANYATEYELQVSEDTILWSTVYHKTDGSGGIEGCILSPSNATFVRLLLKKSNAENYSVNEVQVFGTNNLCYRTNEMPEPREDGTQYLSGGNWRLQRASEVEAEGTLLSSEAFKNDSWLPAVVPGTVLTSYHRAGAIVDPDTSNQQFQVSESFFTADYWYTDHFLIPVTKKGHKVWLTFDSINWKAEIFFNGVLLGNMDGAFIRGRFDITEYTRYGQENYLAVYIHKNAKPGEVKVKTLENAGPNGGILGADNPTIHASIGWDWIPTVRGRNIGIYGPVYLEFTGDVLLQDPWIISELDVTHKDFSEATLIVKTEVRNTKTVSTEITFEGTIQPGDITFNSEIIVLQPGEVREITVKKLIMKNPVLWWPNTYGDQFLYTAKLDVLADGILSDSKEFPFGVRQFTYQTEKPMSIYCNGTRIICRGGNWGMDDGNLAATIKDYEIKVRYHAEENFTMIRNWVGMTNHRAFYDACDKYGILIWDDFWLANPWDGPVPDDDELFMSNVEDKIKHNRYHASIALYCGRNEGYPPEALNKGMKAYTEKCDGTRHYIPHSAADEVSGFGPYSLQDPRWYFENTPVTLHSERGIPNIPTYESMMKMLTQTYAWPINEVWGLHDFCGQGAQNCYEYQEKMKNWYGDYDSLDDFVRIAQMVGYENHKAMFEAVYTTRGNGLLMWMSQSAWPSMVWQTYDYYYDINGSFFGMKKANQPINAIWNCATEDIVLTNFTAKDMIDLKTVMNLYDFNGKLIYTNTVSSDLTSDSITTIMAFPKLKATTDICFIELIVRGADNIMIADNFYWTNTEDYQNYTALKSLKKVPLSLTYVEKTVKCASAENIVVNDTASEEAMCSYEVTVQNTSEVPALLVHIKTKASNTGERILPVFYEDNYFSLMPGQNKTIQLQFYQSSLNGSMPIFTLDGWNVQSIS